MGGCQLVAAQGWRQKMVLNVADSVYIDTFSVLPNSLIIQHKSKLLAAGDYQLLNNWIYFKGQKFDTLSIQYKVIAINLTQARQHKDTLLIGQKTNTDYTLFSNNYIYNPQKTNIDRNQPESKNIDYNGNFTRGLSIGNRQDLVTNSSLNLQLSGKVAGVQINAALSDNNVPLQPNGNSQQLQNFDKMFIQFKIDSHSLTGGDYNLDNPNYNYFSRYTRRLQGAKLENNWRIDSQTMIQNSFSVALARGKFARNNIAGQEGNQGPYKLIGNNGERFLIIIAGTEKVFIDGKLLTRGAENDYIIDYNLAEIRFTNRQLINKDKRVQVDFTYNDINFNRSLLNLQTSYKDANQLFYLDYFSEQDVKNQPANQVLNDSSRSVLANIGDSLNNAFIYSAQAQARGAENTENLLWYKLTDTTINNVFYDSILVYAPNDSMAIYTVQFSLVPQGQGDYIRNINASNGATYSWVAPDALSQQKKGNYAPVRLLISPKKQQLITAGYQYKQKNTQINTHLALSNNDLNTFSDKNDADNWGVAAKLEFSKQANFYTQKLSDTSQNKSKNKSPRNKYAAALSGFYEYVDARFIQLEPYRSREFARDWNTLNLAKTSEHWAGGSLDFFNLSKTIALQINSSFLLKDSLYSGWRNGAKFIYSYKTITFNSQFSYLNNQSDSSKAVFYRPNANLIYTIPQWANANLQASYEQENNQIKNLNGASFNPASFNFKIYKLGFVLPTFRQKWELKAHWQQRTDDSIRLNQLKRISTANEANLFSKFIPNKQNSLELNFNYRQLNRNDTAISGQNSYVGRAEYNFNDKKNIFRLNFIYELGNGQQQLPEYSFIKTDVGAGTHIWIDRNGDALQQLGEFEQAPFIDQADFIKVVALSNRFIQTNNSSYAQSADILFKNIFNKSQKGLNKENVGGKNNPKPDTNKKSQFLTQQIAKISLRSVWKVDKKQLKSNPNGLNPFAVSSLNDTSLIFAQNNLQNTLFYNRNNNLFSAELGQSWQLSRNFLTIGFETRNRREYNANYRFRLYKKLVFNQQATLGNKWFSSDLLANRNFDIEFYTIENQLSANFNQKLRLIGKYNYKNQQNQLASRESAREHKLSIEMTLVRPNSWNVRANLSWVKVDYVGENNSAVQFALLEGLQNGNNWLWGLNLDKPISAFMQLGISYEGRKVGENAIVHVGKMQLRAIF